METLEDWTGERGKDHVMDRCRVNISFKALAKALNLKDGVEILDIWFIKDRCGLISMVFKSKEFGLKLAAGDTYPTVSMKSIQKEKMSRRIENEI